MDVALGGGVGFNLTDALIQTLPLNTNFAKPNPFLFFLALTALYAPFIYKVASKDCSLRMARYIN